MNAALPQNKLRVHYRVLQQGETATVWVAGTTAGDTVTERWPAWLSMSRTQWVPAWLKGEQLEVRVVWSVPAQPGLVRSRWFTPAGLGLC